MDITVQIPWWFRPVSMGFVPQPILQSIVFLQDGLSVAKLATVWDEGGLNGYLCIIEIHPRHERYHEWGLMHSHCS